MTPLTRSLFSKFALLFMLAGLIGGFSPAMARTAATPEAPAAPAADEAMDTLWIAGSAFHPRDGTSAYETLNGCIYAASSGEFTSHIAVPDGAILHTLDTYVIDNSAAFTSVVSLQDANGANVTPRVLATAAIAGSTGFTSSTVAISLPGSGGTPYQVNKASRGLVLDWEPKTSSESMQLCGIRIHYTPAESAPNPSYEFVVGSAFVPRDSTTAYGYGGSGCTSLKNAGRYLVSDVQVPAGAQIFSITSFFQDITSTADLKVSLIEYNGLGISRTLAVATAPVNSSPYTQVSANLTVNPYFSTPLTRSLVLQADFGGVLNNAIRLCGARVQYSPAETAPSGPQTRFIAATTFVPRKWSTDYQSDNAGCITTGDEDDIGTFTAALHIPNGAEIKQIKYFYKSTFSGPTNLALYTVAPNGTLAKIIQANNSSIGTGSVAATLNYKVANDQRGLILEWNPTTPDSRRLFCGAQVTYGFTERVFMPLVMK